MGSMIIFAKLGLFFFGEVCAGSNTFFGFPHWWKYIKSSTNDPITGNCTPDFTFPDDVWAVVLAVTDMLLYLAGIVAVVSIIVAGIGYITSGGNPEKAASARRRIYNSLVGLGIVIVSISVVSFIGSQLGG